MLKLLKIFTAVSVICLFSSESFSSGQLSCSEVFRTFEAYKSKADIERKIDQLASETWWVELQMRANNYSPEVFRRGDASRTDTENFAKYVFDQDIMDELDFSIHLQMALARLSGQHVDFSGNQNGNSFVSLKGSQNTEILRDPLNELSLAKIMVQAGYTKSEDYNPSITPNLRNATHMMAQYNGTTVLLRPFRSLGNLPVDTIHAFIKNLNLFSQSGDPKMQKILSRMFPGHVKGAVYAIPSNRQIVAGEIKNQSALTQEMYEKADPEHAGPEKTLSFEEFYLIRTLPNPLR